MVAIKTDSLQLVACPRERPTCLVASGVLDSIGCTPLMLLKQASEATACLIYAKAEYMNPGGSIKDRIAKHIILEAERRGELKPGATILEVTSGNTGIALAMVGAIRGYHVVIMMPETVSEERRNMIKSLGAELRLLKEINDIQAAVRRSVELQKTQPDIFLPNQFSNADNATCHEQTTGPEIIRQTDGNIMAFNMGVGTGGTLMGVGRALRRANVPARIVAVEPDESAVMSGDVPGRHGIQGLADGFIPNLINLDEIDQIVRISTADAVAAAERLAREEGLLVGISSGANVLAATQVAYELGPGNILVTVLPDRGERYLSLCDGDAGAQTTETCAPDPQVFSDTKKSGEHK
ncbi:MAG: cysteine synthase family protein [Proteobacteria bacterium]|nr:cysteine synthase family protein [Pseudomonadota bacterium]